MDDLENKRQENSFQILHLQLMTNLLICFILFPVLGKAETSAYLQVNSGSVGSYINHGKNEPGSSLILLCVFV